MIIGGEENANGILGNWIDKNTLIHDIYSAEPARTVMSESGGWRCERGGHE